MQSGAAFRRDRGRQGTLDYRAFLTGLERLGRDVPLILDDPEYAVARDEIFGVGDSIGIGLFNRRVTVMAG